MKSKMTRIPPDELNSIKLQEAKIILQKDISTLESLGEEAAVSFFINTNFTYKDKTSKVLPLLILSEFKSAWKDHVRKETKPPAKFGLTGSCTYSFDPETKTRFLNLSITKGKPKSKFVENFIYKSKILPSDVKLNFKENHILEADEAVTALDEAKDPNEIKKDRFYKKIIIKTKEYKAIPLKNGSDRIDSIDDILKLIGKWNNKHLPIDKEDKEGLERQDKLKALEKQLQDHRIDIHIRNREGEPIDAIKKAWKTYKARITVDDSDVLADLEDRLDTLNDLLEDINTWKTRNPAPLSEKEQLLINELNIIEKDVREELEKLKKSLPKVRVESIRLMLEKIKKASPEELEKLKEDSVFMWELSRSVPVAQMNDTRKLLGLPPIDEEDEDIEPFPTNEEAWKDPEILAVFNDFAKFTKFELETSHVENPKLKKKVELLKGTWVWEDGKTIADKFQLDVDTTFKLDSEDNKGNLKLIVTVKGKDKIFYALKKDVAKETSYQVLDPKTELFPTPPSKNHVKQGGLGDCYLLAAVISLVDRDPQFIQDMMLDKGETVTVRLFEVSIAKDGTQSFEAKYFNVDKSIAKNPDGKDAYARDHLWVQMLEKAYAAGNFRGSTKKLEQYIKDNKHEGYKDIAGGYMSFANQILTGKAGERLIFKLKTSSNKDYAVTDIPTNERGKITGNKKFDLQHLPWGTLEKKLFKAAGPSYNKTVSYKIFNKNKTNMLIWWKFVKKGSIDRLFSREFFDDYSGEVTLEDLDLIFQGKMQNVKGEEVKGLPVLKKSIATIMLDWLKNEKLYPGKRGSGIYSTLQLNMFKEIKEALDNKKLVGLNSKVKVGLKVDGKGHSAGESISGGLAGNHAYPVLAAREIAPTKELELKNPWGRTVQKNLTIADVIKELSHKLNNVLLHEIKALTPNVTKLELDHLTALADYENENDKVKKAEFKKLVDSKAKEYGDAKQVILDMMDPKKLTSFQGKITNKYAAYYDKNAPLVIKLKTQDQTKLVSQTASQSDEVGQDPGEFWLLLDDLNKRFGSICIG